ncbi:MAG: hypothetical protein OEL20_04915 [Sulfuritalea sp.]|nr:hypothetical protein [Sulfuritalea sp.]
MSTNTLKVVKGVTITPPVIGRIMIGHVELRQSDDKTRAIPTKDDHFTITTLVQKSDRIWEPHPITETLSQDGQKITSIPVRIAYNDPGLSLQNKYSAFAPDRRVMCSGDGEHAKRMTTSGVQSIDCPGNERCQFGRENRCKNMSRLYLQIEGQTNPLGTFVLRTTSRNSLDSLAGHLARLAGYTSNVLAGMPLMLTLTPMTTAQSLWTVFYVVGLELRAGMSLAEALAAAKEYQEQLAKDGLSQEGMEQAMRSGLANSDFADVVEDPDEWVSEDDVAERAERNLARHGLRGLDSLVASKQGVDSGASPAAPPAPIVAEAMVAEPAGADAVKASGVAAAAEPPEAAGDEVSASTGGASVQEVAVEIAAAPVQTEAAPAAEPSVAEAAAAHVMEAPFFTPPRRPVLAPLPMPPLPRVRPAVRGRLMPRLPAPAAAILRPLVP